MQWMSLMGIMMLQMKSAQENSTYGRHSLGCITIGVSPMMTLNFWEFTWIFLLKSSLQLKKNFLSLSVGPLDHLLTVHVIHLALKEVDQGLVTKMDTDETLFVVKPELANPSAAIVKSLTISTHAWPFWKTMENTLLMVMMCMASASYTAKYFGYGLGAQVSLVKKLSAYVGNE